MSTTSPITTEGKVFQFKEHTQSPTKGLLWGLGGTGLATTALASTAAFCVAAVKALTSLGENSLTHAIAPLENLALPANLALPGSETSHFFNILSSDSKSLVALALIAALPIAKATAHLAGQCFKKSIQHLGPKFELVEKVLPPVVQGNSSELERGFSELQALLHALEGGVAIEGGDRDEALDYLLWFVAFDAQNEGEASDLRKKIEPSRPE